jgi:GNAT superfamily N-acetyltransferase
LTERARVRVAQEADIPEMHRVRVSVRENRLTDPASIGPDEYREMLRARGRGWVAEVDGRIVGFAVADLRLSNVWALFVEPGYEGRGLGRELHDTMMTWVIEQGAERVWLSTDPGTRAERFYGAAGWAHVGFERSGEARFEMPRERWIAREDALPPAPALPAARREDPPDRSGPCPTIA